MIEDREQNECFGKLYFLYGFFFMSSTEFAPRELCTFTAVVATLNNVGPGLNMVGPTGNFADFSVFSKYVLMFNMLAGRLEILPMLILFHPATWKKQ